VPPCRGKKISVIKGQFLHCPYLAPDDVLPSRHRYRAYFGQDNSLDVMARAYTPPVDSKKTVTASGNKPAESREEFQNNPIAWPFHAPTERLRKLPPALIVTNEFDQLVDEGDEYGVRLARAGVRVMRMRSMGTLHGSTCMQTVAPDIVAGTIGMLVGWINALPSVTSRL